MADCQKQFIDFHDAIKLTDENEILREKRDIIIKRLNEKMPDEAKKYITFNQGSYAMNTGIKPLDGDYDIDLGLYFTMSKEDAEPVKAKQWVLDAVTGHTDNVTMKTPCVTLTYKAGYHVDITVYAAENSDEKVYIAKGKPGSKSENKKWEEAAPKTLIQLIADKFEGNDGKQFRRIIRYLKRWKDEQFSTSGSGRPTGIALTLCAYNFMTVKKQTDLFSGKTTYKDLEALIYLVHQVLNSFTTQWVKEEDGYVEYPKLVVNLPVSPYSDIFEKMSSKQMKEFKEKLEKLKEALDKADKEVETSKAAEILRKQFGSDFPVPDPENTVRKASAPTVVFSSESA